MNKYKSLLFFLVLSTFFSAYSQKVKYKDLFVLLNARQYDQAEPFLKKYLQDNNDNPNAFLFMGIIFQEKSHKSDVLKETELLLQQVDSAIFFYNLAVKGITEKELKRNDDYYQMYNRRDLRTGEFGVKLSDIQFDIEKRVQGLKDRQERILKLKSFYVQAQTYYSKAADQHKSLIEKYKSEKDFFLRADERQNSELNSIKQHFDSCVIAFNNYKSTSQLIGKTGYNQLLNLIEIKEFAKDGFSAADFAADDLRLWDYKRWAQNVQNVISGEIIPMREHLVNYDVEINKLREKLRKDSVSVRNDLSQLIDKLLDSQLKKYDHDPFPMQVLGMKIAEIEYSSEVLEHRLFKDSVNAQLQLMNVRSEMSALNRLDSISTQLFDRDINAEMDNYSHFVKSAYGTPQVLKSLISTTKEFAEREKEKKAKELIKREEATKWLIVASDSVPIIPSPARETKFKPLIIVNEGYTAGLTYADTVGVGYFYSITPSRIPDIKVNFPVDNKSFSKRNLSASKALSATDGKGQIYFVGFYSERKQDEKFPITLAKVYRSDGLAWSNNYFIEGIPSELIFNADSGELAVKIATANGESKIITIDKSGKLIQ